MKQYTFKDGFKCVASSVEEAKAKHKVIASNDIRNFDEYKKKFDEYWLPRINSFKEKSDKLKYIEYTVWLTDCDDEYSKFAKWGFDNNISVNKVPISVDWWIDGKLVVNSLDFRNALDIITEEGIDEERFGKDYASGYWRTENISRKGFNPTLKTMTDANKFVEDILKLINKK